MNVDVFSSYRTSIKEAVAAPAFRDRMLSSAMTTGRFFKHLPGNLQQGIGHGLESTGQFVRSPSQVLRKGMTHPWNQGSVGRALLFGLPAYDIYRAARHVSDPNNPTADTRGQAIGRAIGSSIGGVVGLAGLHNAGATQAIAGSAVASTLLGRAGAGIGRAAGNLLTHHPRTVPTSEAVNG